MKWLCVGRDTVILYFADKIGDESLALSLAIANELEHHPPEGLRDFIPAYTSVLLQYDTHQDLPIEAWAKAVASRFQKLQPPFLLDSPPLEIHVHYDGEDFDRVANHTLLPREEIIERHSASVYRVHLIGFTPGFPYLGGLDPKLHTPRLPKPRLMVKVGSIGIGGAQTGIYTVDGPGGWNIIGHSPVRVFDLSRPNPFLLKQGDRVKFVPIR